jgi:peptidoglycan-associated lipoprotein
MRKNMIVIGFLVLIAFGMTIFTGCAEKKTVVKDEALQEQRAKAAQTAQQDNEAARQVKEQADRERALREQAEREQAARASSASATLDGAVEDIYFDFDQSTIRPDAREILKANADILLKRGAAEITVEGYCDERGTAEYNLALGERRAQEAKKYLINLGTKALQIKTISYGEERPLDPGHNEEAWANNRRAHFVVNGK